ncbi:hypothetical protein Pint_13955 [Pistacia integerrima]|uniref:Uncharacterized protein n=1 Tax=Pistacia integerrima TaxID=434235 RepID=A0ACC0Y8P3_9ROSI|nr:hypothetical protein Pint_13955 [Pistacia integerrima]
MTLQMTMAGWSWIKYLEEMCRILKSRMSKMTILVVMVVQNIS